MEFYVFDNQIYHHAHRVACVVHLWRNIKATFKKSRLANLMSAAARTFTVTEFNQKFIEIEKINHACVAYLVDIGMSTKLEYSTIIKT